MTVFQIMLDIIKNYLKIGLYNLVRPEGFEPQPSDQSTLYPVELRTQYSNLEHMKYKTIKYHQNIQILEKG